MKKELKTLPVFFFIFPALAMILQIVAIAMGVMGITDDPDGRMALATWLVIANGLIIMAIIFALVGAIKRTKGMYIIGSGVSLAVGYLATVTVFVMGCIAGANRNNPSYDMVWAGMIISFILSLMTSGLLIIASIITGAKKKGSYAFLGVTSIIALVLFSVFTICITLMVTSQDTNTKVNLLGYTLTNNLSVITLLLSLAILSFLKHPENEVEDPIPGPTIIIANAQVEEATKKYLDDAAKASQVEKSKEIEAPQDDDPTARLRKYKQMLDEGLITEEDYNEKKKELLK